MSINYNEVLLNAFVAPATPARPSGCGRVYVVLSDKTHAKGIAKAAKAMGKIFQAKAHYGMTNALYIGYDNADGYALGIGTSVAAYLNANGIACYRDEHGD